MNDTLLYNTPSLVIAFILLILIFYFLGTNIGYRQKMINPEAKADGIGPLEGSLLGLFALLLSFTLNMTASRYEKRINLATEETNIILTAIHRADLYPDSIRSIIRKDLKLYLEARIAYVNAGNNTTLINKHIDEAKKIYERIWKNSTNGTASLKTGIPQYLFIQEEANLIDAVNSREAARLSRVPDLIMWLLIILNLLGSFTIGYAKNSKKKDWIILLIYAVMTVATIYTITDLDRPSRGIITMNYWNEKLIALKEFL